jgi:hypothetical protein
VHAAETQQRGRLRHLRSGRACMHAWRALKPLSRMHACKGLLPGILPCPALPSLPKKAPWWDLSRRSSRANRVEGCCSDNGIKGSLITKTALSKGN